MPQIMTTGRWGILLLVVVLAAAGCGSANDQNTFNSDAQQHAATWLPGGHAASAAANEESCKECHGSDLNGGISRVSCGSCHLGGPESVHPLAWSRNTATSHGPYATTNGSAACATASCHGAGLDGVANSGPSCSSCHLGGPMSVHPLDWTPSTLVTKHGPYIISVGSYASCATDVCHGTDLKGVDGSGPSCYLCH